MLVTLHYTTVVSHRSLSVTFCSLFLFITHSKKCSKFPYSLWDFRWPYNTWIFHLLILQYVSWTHYSLYLHKNSENIFKVEYTCVTDYRAQVQPLFKQAQLLWLQVQLLLFISVWILQINTELNWDNRFIWMQTTFAVKWWCCLTFSVPFLLQKTPEGCDSGKLKLQTLETNNQLSIGHTES